MNARKSFKRQFNDILGERRAKTASMDIEGGALRGACVLDSLLQVQRQQVDNGGPKEGEPLLDDDFIFNNVRIALSCPLGVLH